MVSLPRVRARVGALRGRAGMGVGLARRRSRAAGVRRRERQVRGGAASRNRRRSRRRTIGSCSRLGRGHVRRLRPHERPDRDDHDRRRVQGLAHAPRHVARRARRARHCGRGDRRAGTVGGRGARRAVPPPRDQARLRRRLRRPSHAASAAECPQPSSGTRGAARTSTAARACGRTGRCQPPDGAFGRASGRAVVGRGAGAGGQRCGGVCCCATHSGCAWAHRRLPRRRRSASANVRSSHSGWACRNECRAGRHRVVARLPRERYTSHGAVACTRRVVARRGCEFEARHAEPAPGGSVVRRAHVDPRPQAILGR